jgi:hypothetical protein
MSQANDVVKIKTYFILNNYFQKSCPLRDNVENYSRAGEATDDNIIRSTKYAICMPDN